jgi:hypothetical protein
VLESLKEASEVLGISKGNVPFKRKNHSIDLIFLGKFFDKDFVF